MSHSEVICQVCALYSYTSTDPSSLSFEQGDIIQVLAQLDSGWWDGWHNGKRGWFPSNYVQVIENEPPTPMGAGSRVEDWNRAQDHTAWHPEYPDLQTRREERQLRLSLSATDVLAPAGAHAARPAEEPAFETKSKSDWILQTTEDGSEVYYYNVVTKEMRHSMPFDDGFKLMPEPNSQPEPSPASPGQGAAHYGYGSFDDYDQKQTRPPRAELRTDPHHRHTENESLKSSSTSTSISTSTPTFYTGRSVVEGQLPPDWVRKTTPKGREYFCNIHTEQTTWSLDNIDPHTGTLLTPTSPRRGTGEEPESGAQDANADAHLSFSQLSAMIAHSIRSLKSSLKQGQISQLKEDALLVVQHIRLLLYVSDTVDKESSLHIKSNAQLKSQHRALLAALAKLVLSAKVASGAWPPSDALIKLQLDADEVLLAVRNFLATAQEMRIEIHDSKPSLTVDPTLPTRWHDNKNLLGESRPDPVTTMLVLADNVQGATTSFMESTQEAFGQTDEVSASVKVNSNTPLLVAQFRNLSNTTSQFLRSVEDLNVAGSLQAARFTAAKKQICNSMGTLFITSQAITKQGISGEAVRQLFEEMQVSTRSIDSSVQELCFIARQLPANESIDGGSTVQGPNEAGRQASGVDVRHTPTPNSLNRPANQALRTADNPVETGQMSPELGIETRQQPKGKLAKFFGEDTLAASRLRDTLVGTPHPQSPGTPPLAMGNQTNPERKDFLGADYDPNEIVFNMEGNVKGGTVKALVQRLTQHDQLDSKFNTTFLLTYRSFCTTQELFDLLFKRYTLSPPEDLTREELEIWQEKKLKLVRLRVFNVIKSWLENYYNEEEDAPMLPVLMEFTDTVIRESMQFGAEQLIKVIKKRMDADQSQIRKMTLSLRTSDMPAPILSKNMKRLRFLDIDPLELARQLTIMDSKLYVRIKPVECLDKNWGKGDSEHIAANVKGSIEYSNQVTAWVTDSILSKDEIKKRAAVMKHWIHVAEKCRLLNNYNTCMAILSAFDNSAIGRMKRSWELISARTLQTLAGIRRLMGANKNFTEYRDIIHKVNPPCIPFLGIYLQDLTFIEDGNSNFLKKSNHLINFSKRMKTAEVIRELQQYQSTPYLLQAVPDIQEFIKTHLQSSRDEETLYNLSLALEPRERGEDTIARRLKESGL